MEKFISYNPIIYHVDIRLSHNNYSLNDSNQIYHSLSANPLSELNI